MFWLVRALAGAVLLILATSFMSHEWVLQQPRIKLYQIKHNTDMSLDGKIHQKNIDVTQRHHFNTSRNTLNSSEYFVKRKSLRNKMTLHNIKGLELFLHAAFLDNRFTGTVVRILGMQRRDEKWDSLGFSCITYLNQKELQRSIAKRYFIDQTWPWWGNHYGIMIDCTFSKLTEADSVTLISNDAKYRYDLDLEVAPAFTSPDDFAVCVKPAYGDIQISRLVEWFEIFRLMGVTRFIIYDSDIRGQSRFVLDFYENQGLLKVVKFHFTAAVRESVKKIHPEMTPGKIDALEQQSFLVAMQDCLYRFHKSFAHILFLDLDEILLPSLNITLPKLLRQLDNQYLHAAGYLFLTSWHFVEHGEVPRAPFFLYMQRHAVGTQPILNQPKSVIRTDRAVSVNFHSILDVAMSGYSNEKMPWRETAYVLHFRGKCLNKFEEKTCKQMMKNTYTDTNLLSYQRDLYTNVKTVLEYLAMWE